MFLKRLEISGFKSFAAKSVLDFEKENHVAAIVGPNGSGKSNVADAIRWVLGETSYKTLRSKKSEDVIFSGSNGKSRSSYAKVSMLLDNSDKRVPIDFTEVEIARSVFRDGTSEYLINGKKARLLDVVEILAKSGFGQSTYSVIGQGMVDSMLFYGPAERKVLFDEAAGVRQYEIKREQTIRKMEETASNIIRIKDILSELNPRLSTLKRQAEKAKEKDALKEDLLGKQKTYFASIWDRYTNVEKGKRAEIGKVVEEEEKLKQEVAALNKEFTELLSEERKDNTTTEKLRAEINQIEKKKDELKQAIYTLRAKIEVLFSTSLSKKDIEAKIKEAKSRLAGITGGETEKEKASLEKELAQIDAEKIREEIREIEKQRDELKQAIFTIRARIEVGSSGDSFSEKEIESKIAALEGELNELRVSEIEKRVEVEEKEVERLKKEEEKIQAKINAKKESLNLLSEEIRNFDFGVVGDELNTILDNQNVFLIKVEAAQSIEDLKEGVEIGRSVSKSLERLIGKVGGAKEGKISGMAELQEEIEALLSEKEELVAKRNEAASVVMRSGFDLSRAQSKRTDIKTEIDRLKKLEPVDKKEIKNLEAEMQENEKKINDLSAKIEEKRAEISKTEAIKARIENLQYQLRSQEEKRTTVEEEIARLEKTKPVDEKEKHSLELEIGQKESEILGLDKEKEAIRVELSKYSSDFSDKGKRLSQIKDQLYSKQSLLSTYGQEISNIRVDLARVETKKQDLKEEIIREIGSEAVLAGVQVVPELHEDEARAQIEKLKGKLYAIGEIDPEVEGEFEEVAARVEFLSGQITDLEKAKTDLEKLINELDGRIKKQFETSFAAISAKFTHFFNLLFEGGTAKLELVRSKDEEEETERFGIEITAIPPGKRVQSLSALSGGERTLTSLALLFAILSVNPAPFCVLDEVDAALDESNTKRFLKIVHELAPQTQFIFITHNRETMKEGNIIYGITMDDTHASKLLSVKLSDALETAKK